MSDSKEKPWSDNPNAPKVPYHLYFDEKANFSGYIVSSVLYGTPKARPPTRSSNRTHFVRSIVLGFTIVLAFKCVTALVNPAYRRAEPIKWGLITYTAVMFSFTTVQTVVALYVQSISYIDSRKFPGIEGVISPGPIGYLVFVSHTAFDVGSWVLFFVNSWLADGLLVSFLNDVTLTYQGA